MERIRSAVIAEAKAKAESIANKAKTEAESRLQSAQAEIAAETKRLADESRASCDEEHRQRTGRLKAGLRVELLVAKSELIRKVFQEALKTLANLPREEYLRLMGRWLEDAGAEAGGEIVANERDLGLFRNGFLDKVNASRPTDGKFTLAQEPLSVAGGFVLRRKGFEIDMRLESQLAMLKDEALPEIAKILFGGEAP
ncbi:MAG: V-type ATP synthase subunit E [Planctomycetota bacterium]